MYELTGAAGPVLWVRFYREAVTSLQELENFKVGELTWKVGPQKVKVL